MYTNLGWCPVQCREFVNCLRFALYCLNSLTLDDIVIQVDDMLTMCYERLASAYCILGIRRKAEDHALLPPASLKAANLSSPTSFRQVEIQELIVLIDWQDGHECFLKPIRSIMKVKSQSTSPNMIASPTISG